MPIHIKGSGGADKSKGLTATQNDIAKGKTALVNGKIVTGNSPVHFFYSPDETEGSENVTRTIVIEDEAFDKTVGEINFRRESWNPDDTSTFEPRVVIANTIHSFFAWWAPLKPGTSGSFEVMAEVFASTTTDRLTIRRIEIEYDYTTLGMLELTLPSSYSFEGEWIYFYGYFS